MKPIVWGRCRRRLTGRPTKKRQHNSAFHKRIKADSRATHQPPRSIKPGPLIPSPASAQSRNQTVEFGSVPNEYLIDVRCWHGADIELLRCWVAMGWKADVIGSL